MRALLRSVRMIMRPADLIIHGYGSEPEPLPHPE